MDSMLLCATASSTSSHPACPSWLFSPAPRTCRTHLTPQSSWGTASSAWTPRSSTPSHVPRLRLQHRCWCRPNRPPRVRTSRRHRCQLRASGTVYSADVVHHAIGICSSTCASSAAGSQGETRSRPTVIWDQRRRDLRSRDDADGGETHQQFTYLA